jgi:cell division protein FtsI (penicillin-binding protein 3)
MDFAADIERKKARRRTRLLAVFLGLWSVGILARLVELQVFEHRELSRQVAGQNRFVRLVRTDRGTIYDRTGRILAQSIPSQSVIYRSVPGAPVDAQMAPILKVAPLLGLDRESLEQKRRQVESGKPFIFLKREVDPDTARRIKEGNVRGIDFEEEPRRIYPYRTLAAHVLGGADKDEKGLAGVELRYNSVLGGRPGRRLVIRDGHRREYNVETTSEPKPGKDIELSLDIWIQSFAQQALEKAMAAHEADWGTVIVSSPTTGEILAMASAPGYDPNVLSAAKPEQATDRSIRHLFDPGSTFKIVPAAAALEHGLADLSDVFNCAAEAISVAGGPIRDHRAFGVLSFADIIAHSSNIGTIQVGRRLGQDLLYRTIRDFGFGERTGIDLPAEAAGMIHPPESWSRRSLDAVSVGYEVSVTAIQILQALNVIANRGEAVPPHLLKAIDHRPAQREPRSAALRVISAAAAEKLVSVLVRAVGEGTGQAAVLPGYVVAGKTGTAQLKDREGKGYSSERHLAAFAGFVPALRPALSIVVVISDPKKEDVYYGGQVAAPVFREIASRAVRYLGVPPEAGPPSSVVTARLQNEARR